MPFQRQPRQWRHPTWGGGRRTGYIMKRKIGAALCECHISVSQIRLILSRAFVCTCGGSSFQFSYFNRWFRKPRMSQTHINTYARLTWDPLDISSWQRQLHQIRLLFVSVFCPNHARWPNMPREHIWTEEDFCDKYSLRIMLGCLVWK